MKKINLCIAMLLSSVALLSSCGSSVGVDRESDFNFDWKFTELADTTTLANLPLADGDWRDVRLPHDWSVEHSFDENLAGCTGYLPGGVGVYQKHFVTENNAADKSTYVLFDGVYNTAKFWLNGEYLGENPYGYSPTYFNLTDVLNGVGEENILTVYVDHSRYADSRWYTGSGIYRNVKLVTLDKLHIPIWGTFVTTPEITEAEAKVNIEVTIENENAVDAPFTLTTTIYDVAGAKVATSSDDLTLAAGDKMVTEQMLAVANPALWDIDTPNMYKAITTITSAGTMVDEYTTPFGIRTIEFDKDKGFFLNGKNTYVKGVCLHHDGGLVGAAVPEGVWRRRFALLKEGGVNAIRTAHNPFSEEFLDLCDEMGFLVQNEFFDEMDNPKNKRMNGSEEEIAYYTRGYGAYFHEWSESDLKRTMLRDRNHPSVFEWSIGNEIEHTYQEYKDISGMWDPGRPHYWNQTPPLTPAQMRERYDNLPPMKYNLAKTAERLAGYVRELDTTRPVTANLIAPVASSVTGYAAALDVVGVSYQIKQYDWLKEHFPDMLITGNENSGYLSEWRTVTDNPMIFSMYMWTGIDYLGESSYKWPQKAWPGDMIDLAGFPTCGFNHFKSIWVDEPMIALQTHSIYKVPERDLDGWENYLADDIWNYKDQEPIVVEIVTNQPSATLYLNGESLGEKWLKDNQHDLILRWEVPFEAGVLEARSGDLVTQIKTAGEAVAIEVDVDKSTLVADGYDVAHIVAQLVDADGVAVRTENQRVTFDIEGDLNLLGVDNGWNKSTQDFQSDNVETYLGHCLALVQSYRAKSGGVKVTISAEGLPSEVVEIVVK